VFSGVVAGRLCLCPPQCSLVEATRTGLPATGLARICYRNAPDHPGYLQAPPTRRQSHCPDSAAVDAFRRFTLSCSLCHSTLGSALVQPDTSPPIALSPLRTVQRRFLARPAKLPNSV